MRDEHIAFQQQQNKMQRIRQEEIVQREEHAKKHVMSVLKEKSKRIQRKEVVDKLRLVLLGKG